MKLNYKSIGNGKPVIIAHGLFGSLDNWMSIGNILGEFFRVYLVDMRNHGKSPHSPLMNYQLMAEDLYRFMDEHSLEETSIIGHSMGGKAAMKLTLDQPERFHKLIVVDIGTKAYEPRHDQIIRGLKSIHIERIGSRQEADSALSQYISDQSIRQFLLKGLYRNDQKKFEFRYNLDVLSQNIEEIGAEIQGVPSYVDTMFVRGTQSDYILETDIPDLEEIFPNCLVETINEAGHWIHAEKPDEFIQVILPFLIY